MDGDFRDIDAGHAPRRPRLHAMTTKDGTAPGRADADGAAHAATTLPSDVPAYDVRRLMRGGGQAHLVLDGVAYTLRITRAGKLILTK